MLQTGAAYGSIERIHSLYRVSLLGMDNVESRARKGKSWRKIPVALCMTEVRCLVNEKFGIKEKAEISDLCIPRNYSALEMKRCWRNRSASSG